MLKKVKIYKKYDNNHISVFKKYYLYIKNNYLSFLTVNF